MTRRFAVFGLLVVLSQLAAGCCWHRCCWGWRWHHFHHCGACAPACPAPVVGGPVVGGPVGCPSCYTPGPDHPPVVYGPPPGGAVPGGPVITNPMPIYPGVGPVIDPATGAPMPMPPTKTPGG